MQRGNIDAIYTGGPSLGTMESEQQHVYGCRMDAFPCAWTLRGAVSLAGASAEVRYAAGIDNGMIAISW